MFGCSLPTVALCVGGSCLIAAVMPTEAAQSSHEPTIPQERRAPANVGPQLASAASRYASTTGYTARVWTTADGLPQNSVTSIVQTRDGYLWLGTFGGLARFDGVRFEVFDIANTPALRSNRILSLCEDQIGNLWIGTLDAGVTRYRDGTFVHCAPGDGVPPGQITIVEDADGTVWFGGNGLTRFANGEFESFAPFNDRRQVRVNSMVVDNEGLLWAATSSGLMYFREGRFQRCQIDDEKTARNIAFVGSSRDGEIWVGLRPARKIDGRVVTSRVMGLDRARIFASKIDSRGTFWIGSAKGVGLVKEGASDQVDSDWPYLVEHALDVDAGWGARSIIEDREGNIWIGTDGAGLVRMRPKLFDKLDKLKVRLGHGTPRITNDGNGGFWVGHDRAPGVLRILGADVVETLQGDKRVGIRNTRALYRRRDGSLWIAHGKWLTAYRDGRYEHHEHGLPGEVRAILEDREGAIWVGTSMVLARLNDGRFMAYPRAEGDFYPAAIQVITQARDGALWIGTDLGVRRLEGDQVTHLTEKDGLPRGPVRSILEDSEGTIWIGTYGGGLARFENGTFRTFTSSDGLCDNAISYIAEDGARNLWINSNRGVFRIRLDDVSDYIAGRTAELRCILIATGEAQGRSGAISDDGKLCVPAIDGLVILDTEQVGPNESPPMVHVERFGVGPRVFDLTKPIEIPPGRRDISIQFTGLSFTDPENVRFKYRLGGTDEEWIDAGRRRTAEFSFLPPGDYRFHVVASNADGVWNEAGAEIAFVVTPFMYETVWFRVMCGAALAGLAYGSHRLRSRRLRRHNRELSREIDLRTQAERRLQMLIETAPDPIVVTRRDGTITLVNRQTEALLGYQRDELIGRQVELLLPEQQRQIHVKHREEYWRAPTLRPMSRVMELRARHKDGGMIPVEISLSPIEIAEGAIAFASIRDISDRKRDESALQMLSGRLIEAQEEERRRIARELHDDFNQRLALLSVELEILEQESTESGGDSVERLHQLATTTKQLSSDVHRLSHQLHPAKLDQLGLVAAARSYCAEISRQQKVRIAFTARDVPTALPSSPGLCLYRIIQEALRNVVKHSRAAEASVELIGCGDALNLQVTDSGVGFDLAQTNQQEGLGIISMRERIRAVKGEISIHTAPGDGTRIEVSVPLSASS